MVHEDVVAFSQNFKTSSKEFWWQPDSSFSWTPSKFLFFMAQSQSDWQNSSCISSSRFTAVIKQLLTAHLAGPVVRRPKQFPVCWQMAEDWCWNEAEVGKKGRLCLVRRQVWWQQHLPNPDPLPWHHPDSWVPIDLLYGVATGTMVGCWGLSQGKGRNVQPTKTFLWNTAVWHCLCIPLWKIGLLLGIGLLLF